MNNDENDRNQKKAQEIKLWGVFLFGLIGAGATAFSLSRSQSKGGSGSSFRSAFQEEAWKRYNKRMQEEYEEEMERVNMWSSTCLEAQENVLLLILLPVFDTGLFIALLYPPYSLQERIKRMQSVFNRERDKHRRNYERWKENGSGAHHQNFQRDDWYWKAEASYREQWANYQRTQRESGNYSLSHHYSVLGLDRSRTTPYTDAEIKTAFRTKAKQYHPDQNQDNRGASEAKFKEVISSYEAIQQERKNQSM